MLSFYKCLRELDVDFRDAFSESEILEKIANLLLKVLLGFTLTILIVFLAVSFLNFDYFFPNNSAIQSLLLVLYKWSFKGLSLNTVIFVAFFNWASHHMLSNESKP